MSKKADFKYKNDHNLEERKNESSRILREYQNRLPIICELAPQSQLPPLKKTKYLVPSDMTINQFLFIIRRSIDLNQGLALYLFTSDKKTVTGNKTIMDLYGNHKDKEDNFLYLYCDCELIYG